MAKGSGETLKICTVKYYKLHKFESGFLLWFGHVTSLQWPLHHINPDANLKKIGLHQVVVSAFLLSSPPYKWRFEDVERVTFRWR